MPFYNFLGEGSPTKIDYRKRVPSFTSLLENLVASEPQAFRRRHVPHLFPTCGSFRSCGFVWQFAHVVWKGPTTRSLGLNSHEKNGWPKLLDEMPELNHSGHMNPNGRLNPRVVARLRSVSVFSPFVFLQVKTSNQFLAASPHLTSSVKGAQ